MKKIKTIILLVLTIFSFSSMSFAQINNFNREEKNEIYQNTNSGKEAFDLVNWSLSFLALVDMVYIIYNSFGYVSSGKEIYSSGIKKGLVGMLGIFLAWSLVSWLRDLNSLEN